MKTQMLLALAAGLLAGTAHAEWQLVEAGPAIRHYFDPETLQKTDGFPSVMVLHDFNEPTRQGELSARYRAQFDCDARRWRLSDFATFDGAMASGAVVMQTDGDVTAPAEWRDLPGGPAFLWIFRFACGE